MPTIIDPQEERIKALAAEVADEYQKAYEYSRIYSKPKPEMRTYARNSYGKAFSLGFRGGRRAWRRKIQEVRSEINAVRTAFKSDEGGY